MVGHLSVQIYLPRSKPPAVCSVAAVVVNTGEDLASSGVTSNRFGPYTLVRQVGPPSISKFGGIPRKRMPVR